MDGLFDLRRSNEDHFVSGGDGGKISKIEFFAEFRGSFIDQDGVEQSITLKDVGFLKGREVNLFSLTKETEENWILSGDKNHIKITYQGTIMIFKEKLETSIGHVFSTRLYAQRNVNT